MSRRQPPSPSSWGARSFWSVAEELAVESGLCAVGRGPSIVVCQECVEAANRWPRQRPTSPFDQSLVLYPALRKARIEPGKRTHGFHLFRHSAASILAELTRDPLLVRDLLRHSRLSTTAGYVHTEVVAEGASEALADAIIGKGERVN